MRNLPNRERFVDSIGVLNKNLLLATSHGDIDLQRSTSEGFTGETYRTASVKRSGQWLVVSAIVVSGDHD